MNPRLGPLAGHENASEPRRAGMPGGWRVVVVVVLLVGTLTLLFGEGLLEYVRFAADPWHFNDDARQQIWPLLRYADADLFRGDYVADYYLANLPRGYRLLYASSAPLVDPRTLSKALPYAELLVVLYSLVAASWRLAGPAAAWGTGALCLSTTVFVARMSGGLPRSFAFPLVALAVLALVRGKAGRLCVLTLLGAAFYYPVGILVGLVAAIHLLLTPRSWQGDSRAWSLGRRVAVLSATAGAAGLLAIPALVAGRPFGPLLGSGDSAAYPEAGPGGRYADADLPLRVDLVKTVVRQTGSSLLSVGPAWNVNLQERGRRAALKGFLTFWLGLLISGGYASLLVTETGARRLLALMLAAFVLYPLSLALWPRLYLPARYLAYTFPVFIPVLLPAGIASLTRRLPLGRFSPVASATVVVGAIGLLLLFLGGRGPGHAGISVTIPEEQRPLYEFLARLPPDVTIAGWPGGAIENVPYLSGRKILLGFEVHQAFHKVYVEEMRRRMQALIDAYFARDVAPLLRLRREFGVTHLLVNRDHYGRAAPSYFKPFDARIADAVRASSGEPETLRQASSAGVFEDGPLVLLALDRIAESGRSAGHGSERAG